MADFILAFVIGLGVALVALGVLTGLEDLLRYLGRRGEGE